MTVLFLVFHLYVQDGITEQSNVRTHTAGEFVLVRGWLEANPHRRLLFDKIQASSPAAASERFPKYTLRIESARENRVRCGCCAPDVCSADSVRMVIGEIKRFAFGLQRDAGRIMPKWVLRAPLS